MTAVELFSGAGGMALGFEQAGFDVLAAIDLDPVHLAAHERNFPLCVPLCEDVSRVDRADVLAAAQRGWAHRNPGTQFSGPVDCLFGGPSCQGFSTIGHQDPGDPRNALIAEFARVVDELRPRWFVLENVPGLLGANYRRTVQALYRDLRRAGYRVADPWLLNARDHGTPQDRRRAFVVGARAGEPLPAPPRSQAPAVTVAEAIGDLSRLGLYRRLYGLDTLDLTDRELEAMALLQSEYVRRLNRDAIDAKDLSDVRQWDRSRLTSVGLTQHGPAIARRFASLRPGERDRIGRLPRLDPNGQSPTLRAGTGRDHGSFTSARPIHYQSARVITVREAARLHGFPDWFGFHATKWHGFRQVGNAVPPPLARAVASMIVAASGARPIRRRTSVELGSERLLNMTLTQAAERFSLDAARLPADVRRRNDEIAHAKEIA